MNQIDPREKKISEIFQQMLSEGMIPASQPESSDKAKVVDIYKAMEQCCKDTSVEFLPRDRGLCKKLLDEHWGVMPTLKNAEKIKKINKIFIRLMLPIFFRGRWPTNSEKATRIAPEGAKHLTGSPIHGRPRELLDGLGTAEESQLYTLGEIKVIVDENKIIAKKHCVLDHPVALQYLHLQEWKVKDIAHGGGIVFADFQVDDTITEPLENIIRFSRSLLEGSRTEFSCSTGSSGRFATIVPAAFTAHLLPSSPDGMESQSFLFKGCRAIMKPEKLKPAFPRAYHAIMAMKSSADQHSPELLSQGLFQLPWIHSYGIASDQDRKELCGALASRDVNWTQQDYPLPVTVLHRSNESFVIDSFSSANFFDNVENAHEKLKWDRQLPIMLSLFRHTILLHILRSYGDPKKRDDLKSWLSTVLPSTDFDIYSSDKHRQQIYEASCAMLRESDLEEKLYSRVENLAEEVQKQRVERLNLFVTMLAVLTIPSFFADFVGFATTSVSFLFLSTLCFCVSSLMVYLLLGEQKVQRFSSAVFAAIRSCTCSNKITNDEPVDFTGNNSVDGK